MEEVQHKILVLSGKGGVGKSTVASHLARAMVEQGLTVGLLDIDLCGPSLPHMLGLDQAKIHQSSSGWVPVYTDSTKRLAVVSIGFLLADKATAVVWRGPKKTATIKQFLEDVTWGPLDVLIIDTPPGTSDEHISVCEYLQAHDPDGAVVVTTPQGVALSDVSKEITFCKSISMPVLGLVENMSGFRCPTCDECTNIFATGGGEALATNVEVPFLGRIPIDPLLSQCTERGENALETDSAVSLQCLRDFAENFARNSCSPKANSAQ